MVAINRPAEIQQMINWLRLTAARNRPHDVMCGEHGFELDLIAYIEALEANQKLRQKRRQPNPSRS